VTKIVGVHGVGNHRPALTPPEAAGQLARIWSARLAPDVDLEMAYYAHHLRGSVAHSGSDLPESLDEEALEMLLSWARVLETEPAGVEHGWVTAPARHLIARMTGRPFTRLPQQLFILLFLKEVQFYLGRRYRQRRIDAREQVATVIKKHRPSVVLAHSLGSVVAYEALCADPELKIDLLVTLGSPLALPYTVLHRLEPGLPADGGLMPRPPGVGRWVNLADPGDLCAVPPWLSTRFPVDIDRQTTIGTFAFHKVARYLDCVDLEELLS